MTLFDILITDRALRLDRWPKADDAIGIEAMAVEVMDEHGTPLMAWQREVLRQSLRLR